MSFKSHFPRPATQRHLDDWHGVTGGEDLRRRAGGRVWVSGYYDNQRQVE